MAIQVRAVRSCGSIPRCRKWICLALCGCGLVCLDGARAGYADEVPAPLTAGTTPGGTTSNGNTPAKADSTGTTPPPMQLLPTGSASSQNSSVTEADFVEHDASPAVVPAVAEQPASSGKSPSAVVQASASDPTPPAPPAAPGSRSNNLPSASPAPATGTTTPQPAAADVVPAPDSSFNEPLDSSYDPYGVQLRAAGVQGQGPVQDASIFPVESFPYIRVGDSLFFSDLRFFPTVDGTFGGNVGFGYRYYDHDWDRVFGISGWYDADGTHVDYLSQVGLSLETYGSCWDFRTNLYLPVGAKDRVLSDTVLDGSPHFAGNNLLYTDLREYIAAMRGVDMEVGVPIPGRFAHDHQLRIYGGWYGYDDDQHNHILGGSARVQANIWSGLDAAVQITNDNYFDTRAFFTVAWTFGALHRSALTDDTQESRLGEHVTRNYTVLAPLRTEADPDVAAIDPATGAAWTFAHVDSAAAAGGNGTASAPFQTIAQAQAVNPNIIFVHANSVFTGSAATITMTPGEAILGDGGGVGHQIAASGVGYILLPKAPSSSSLPVLDSATGNSVTLASNSVLNGFTITNAAGNGIFGNGVGGTLVSNVTVSNSGADGIHLLNSTGNNYLINTTILNSGGNGLVVAGGGSTVEFAGSIANSQGYDLVVQNTSAGVVDMTQATFNGTGSQGILLQNDAGGIKFNNLTVTDTAGRGIDIEGLSGQAQFAGTTTVSGAAGESVYINNLMSSGSVTFDTLSIDHRQNAGLVINNSVGAVTVNDGTTITNELASSASGISITNSSSAVTFTGTVNVTNSSGSPGVSLTNDSGTTTFSTLNITSAGGTGLYANNGGSLVINSNQTAGQGGTISAVSGTAVDIENTNMNINLESVSSSGAAVGMKFVSASGSLFVLGDGNDTPGSGGTIQAASTGVLIQNSGTIGLIAMNLNSNGVGVSAQNSDYLGLSHVALTNSASYGVQALDTKTLQINNSSFSGNGGPNILAQSDAFNAYSYTLSSNTFGSAAGDNVVVQSLTGSAGSTLAFTAGSNTFTNAQAGTTGINLSWNGFLTGTINQNSFTGTGGSNRGILISTPSTTDLATVSVTNNTFTANGGNDTGFQVISGGPSQLTLTSNNVQFGASGGTGFRFSLAPSANLTLSDNNVVDTTHGATGILFDSVTGPGSLTINANSLTLPGPSSAGIVFSSVTDPLISGATFAPTLIGTQSNVINGAVTPFSVPTGTVNGTILVNGTTVP